MQRIAPPRKILSPPTIRPATAANRNQDRLQASQLTDLYPTETTGDMESPLAYGVIYDGDQI